MNTNWGELSQAQLEQMLKEIQGELDDRRISKKKEAWKKVEIAIKEYLQIGSIQIESIEAGIYIDSDDSLNIDSPGYIGVNC